MITCVYCYDHLYNCDIVEREREREGGGDTVFTCDTMCVKYRIQYIYVYSKCAICCSLHFALLLCVV